MKSLSNNPLKQAILDTVAPVLESRNHGAPATITQYNKENCTANIIVDVSGQKVTRLNVPIARDNGLVPGKMVAGQQVWVDFKGGSLQDPIIVSRHQAGFWWGNVNTKEAQWSPLETDADFNMK